MPAGVFAVDVHSAVLALAAVAPVCLCISLDLKACALWLQLYIAYMLCCIVCCDAHASSRIELSSEVHKAISINTIIDAHNQHALLTTRCTACACTAVCSCMLTVCSIPTVGETPLCKTDAYLSTCHLSSKQLGAQISSSVQFSRSVAQLLHHALDICMLGCVDSQCESCTARQRALL
jgi:hypothetical protein